MTGTVTGAGKKKALTAYQKEVFLPITKIAKKISKEKGITYMEANKKAWKTPEAQKLKDAYAKKHKK